MRHTLECGTWGGDPQAGAGLHSCWVVEFSCGLGKGLEEKEGPREHDDGGGVGGGRGWAGAPERSDVRGQKSFD
ncbi:hypothetical protein Tco_0602255 [Tanacetum coccineum]